ncbi:hypothetical protein Q9R32_10820 [Actinotalea sp. AC32]|nr:hypothetical protein [Actinotalea sp. AC32]
MPVLEAAVTGLGLHVPVVEDTAWAMVTAAEQAVHEHDPRSGEVADYVAAHALRGLGLLALVDQEAAADAARRVARWLAHAKHPGWPLALAVLDHRTLRAVLDGEDDLLHVPLDTHGYPGDLLRLAAGAVDDDLGPDDALDPAYGRPGLNPFGIDLRLLHATVRGGSTTEFGYISAPSAPAVLGVLLGSVQDAVDRARRDEESWSIGLGPVAATDPEILLTLHAVRRSPAAFAIEHDAHRRPQVQAALAVVDAVDPW